LPERLRTIPERGRLDAASTQRLIQGLQRYNPRGMRHPHDLSLSCHVSGIRCASDNPSATNDSSLMPDPAANVTTLYSPDFLQLQRLFRALRKPYGATEIRHFNRVYRRLYPTLTPHEKTRTEAWVDELVAHVEWPELASTIYGVV
jgi:hypothetical protein